MGKLAYIALALALAGCASVRVVARETNPREVESFSCVRGWTWDLEGGREEIALPDRATLGAVEGWFPESHSDVGGGYEEAELSYAPLNWMVQMSVRHGLLVDMSKIPLEPYFESAMPVVHDETASFGWKLTNLFGGGRFDRSVAVTDFVHPTVAQLRGLGYSPQFLPANCVVWSADGSVSNVA